MPRSAIFRLPPRDRINAEHSYVADESRLVDFVGSTPAGDIALGELRGPLQDETHAWLMRLAMGARTVHATAAEGHDRLMLAKAYDLSARIKAPVALPLSADEKRTRRAEAET